MKLKPPIIILFIMILGFAFLIVRPIQEKCFGEEKPECVLLDELNIEHVFYLIVLISLLMIIRDSKKKQETLNNLLDVLISK